jgi:hypothetical protein
MPSNPPIIQLLNKQVFDQDDFQALVALLQQDPSAASQLGSHKRSAIWVCCQHSDCSWRRNIIPPLLVQYGANVNQEADNGFTPVQSLYKKWTLDKEHARTMASILVLVHGAQVNDPHIQHWLDT